MSAMVNDSLAVDFSNIRTGAIEIARELADPDCSNFLRRCEQIVALGRVGFERLGGGFAFGSYVTPCFPDLLACEQLSFTRMLLAAHVYC